MKTTEEVPIDPEQLEESRKAEAANRSALLSAQLDNVKRQLLRTDGKVQDLKKILDALIWHYGAKELLAALGPHPLDLYTDFSFVERFMGLVPPATEHGDQYELMGR